MVDLTFHWIYFEIIVYCADLDYCCTNDIGRTLPLLELQFSSSYCTYKTFQLIHFKHFNRNYPLKMGHSLIKKIFKIAETIAFVYCDCLIFRFCSVHFVYLFVYFLFSLNICFAQSLFLNPIPFLCFCLNAFFYSIHFIEFQNFLEYNIVSISCGEK